MIDYHFGTWGLSFIFQSRGSVFRKSLLLAVPNALLSTVCWWYVDKNYRKEREDIDAGDALGIWGNYTFVLGFLLVFRTNIAYQRFWEGGTTLQQVRGVWFNATSNIVAFCSTSPDDRERVGAFQHLITRLVSMLYCAALQQVADSADGHFDILGCYGMDVESLRFLHDAEDRTEVLMQWIQRLIVTSINDGVLPIAPPIASRVFQELSNGIVDVQNAKKIREFPFPFPYAQLLSTLIIIHWLLTPWVAALICNHAVIAAAISFVSIFAFASILYIAAELEMPFGDDPNDLPLHAMVVKFNTSLIRLLNPLTQNPPAFNYQPEVHAGLLARKMQMLTGEVEEEPVYNAFEGDKTLDSWPLSLRADTEEGLEAQARYRSTLSVRDCRGYVRCTVHQTEHPPEEERRQSMWTALQPRKTPSAAQDAACMPKSSAVQAQCEAPAARSSRRSSPRQSVASDTNRNGSAVRQTDEKAVDGEVADPRGLGGAVVLDTQPGVEKTMLDESLSFNGQQTTRSTPFIPQGKERSQREIDIEFETSSGHSNETAIM